MPPMQQSLSASPCLLVADVQASAAYYRDRLGFAVTLHGDPPDFVVAERDDAIFLLAACDDETAIVPNWQVQDKTWNAYVRCADADALYAELIERGAIIDYEIYDAPHGFREFGVQDPDGYDIAFGQRVVR